MASGLDKMAAGLAKGAEDMRRGKNRGKNPESPRAQEKRDEKHKRSKRGKRNVDEEALAQDVPTIVQAPRSEKSLDALAKILIKTEESPEIIKEKTSVTFEKLLLGDGRSFSGKKYEIVKQEIRSALLEQKYKESAVSVFIDKTVKILLQGQDLTKENTLTTFGNNLRLAVSNFSKEQKNMSSFEKAIKPGLEKIPVTEPELQEGKNETEAIPEGLQNIDIEIDESEQKGDIDYSKIDPATARVDAAHDAVFNSGNITIGENFSGQIGNIGHGNKVDGSIRISQSAEVETVNKDISTAHTEETEVNDTEEIEIAVSDGPTKDKPEQTESKPKEKPAVKELEPPDMEDPDEKSKKGETLPNYHSIIDAAYTDVTPESSEEILNALNIEIKSFRERLGYTNGEEKKKGSPRHEALLAVFQMKMLAGKLAKAYEGKEDGIVYTDTLDHRNAILEMLENKRNMVREVLNLPEESLDIIIDSSKGESDFTSADVYNKMKSELSRNATVLEQLLVQHPELSDSPEVQVYKNNLDKITPLLEDKETMSSHYSIVRASIDGMQRQVDSLELKFPDTGSQMEFSEPDESFLQKQEEWQDVTSGVEQVANKLRLLGMRIPKAGPEGKFGARSFREGLILGAQYVPELENNTALKKKYNEILEIVGYVPDDGLTQENIIKLEALVEEIGLPENPIHERIEKAAKLREAEVVTSLPSLETFPKKRGFFGKLARAVMLSTPLIAVGASLNDAENPNPISATEKIATTAPFGNPSVSKQTPDIVFTTEAPIVSEEVSGIGKAPEHNLDTIANLDTNSWVPDIAEIESVSVGDEISSEQVEKLEDYKVLKNDNLTKFIDGRLHGREMLPALAEVPEKDREHVIRHVLTALKMNPALQKEIGIFSGSIDKIFVNQLLHTQKLNEVIKTIVEYQRGHFSQL